MALEFEFPSEKRLWISFVRKDFIKSSKHSFYVGHEFTQYWMTDSYASVQTLKIVLQETDAFIACQYSATPWIWRSIEIEMDEKKKRSKLNLPINLWTKR